MRSLISTLATLPLLLLATAPPATAFAAVGDNTGVCVDDLFQPGYTECWGLVKTAECDIGVGHWYHHRPTGNSHTWCYAGVDL